MSTGCYRDVMLEGGFAVDAAVAGMFCNGVFTSQSMGLGGGFLMTIHQASTGQTFTLNAREAAPGLAERDMFGDCEAEFSSLIGPHPSRYSPLIGSMVH